MPNKPKAALIYFTKADLDTTKENPFIFNHYNCSSVNLQLDATDMEFMYDFSKHQGAATNAYANLVRVMAPERGKFAIFSRARMLNGCCVLCVDLTRSGRVGVDDLDVPDVKSPSTVQIVTKHSRPLEEDISVHCIFISAARLDISTADGLKIEYL